MALSTLRLHRCWRWTSKSPTSPDTNIKDVININPWCQIGVETKKKSVSKNKIVTDIFVGNSRHRHPRSFFFLICISHPCLKVISNRYWPSFKQFEKNQDADRSCDDLFYRIGCRSNAWWRFQPFFEPSFYKRFNRKISQYFNWFHWLGKS